MVTEVITITKEKFIVTESYAGEKTFEECVDTLICSQLNLDTYKK